MTNKEKKQVIKHRGHYRLPRWIRKAFFSCCDCYIPLRKAKQGKGFGTPQFVYTTPFKGAKKYTKYACLKCELQNEPY